MMRSEESILLKQKKRGSGERWRSRDQTPPKDIHPSHTLALDQALKMT